MSAATEQAKRIATPGFVWTTNRSSRVGLAALKELWQFRDVVAALASRYVRVKYAQAWFGIGWAALQPIVLAGIVVLLANRLNLGGEDIFVEVLLGMMAWAFFATAVSGASESLIEGRELLTKVYFPREAMPVAAVIAAGLDLAVSVIVVIAIAVVLVGETPTIAWFAIPIALAVVTAAATVAALASSVVNAYYRDVRYALPFALQVGLFLSAVFYPIEAFPHHDLYAILNPVAGSIDVLRDAVIADNWPDAGLVAAQVVWLGAGLVLSYHLFRRLAPTLVERM
jgi:lipopolysaccharide transport system permease protein